MFRKTSGVEERNGQLLNPNYVRLRNVLSSKINFFHPMIYPNLQACLAFKGNLSEYGCQMVLTYVFTFHYSSKNYQMYIYFEFLQLGDGKNDELNRPVTSSRISNNRIFNSIIYNKRILSRSLSNSDFINRRILNRSFSISSLHAWCMLGC